MLHARMESRIDNRTSNGAPVGPAGKTFSRRLAGFGIFWALALVFGSALMLRYAYTPGAMTTPPVCWPAESRAVLSPAPYTLLIFVHPHCPCTRATIAELDRLMTLGHHRLQAQVWFAIPEGQDERWGKTELWRSAERIPGVTVIADRAGVEAERFHAATSGEAILYDSKGALAFYGGITRARGHAGDNAGSDIIRARVRNEPIEQRTVPVFGCSLANPALPTNISSSPAEP